MGLSSPSRENKFSGANGDREIFNFPAQLTTSRLATFHGRSLLLLYLMIIHIHAPLQLHAVA